MEHRLSLSIHHKHIMKTTILKSITTGFLAIGALALVSCQAPMQRLPASAVTCSKCHTVSFKSPQVTSAAGDKGFVTLRSSSKMSCPDCENKIVAWAKKGEFTEHVCKSCGGTMRHCTNH
jgi:ribosomal protein L40E